jgi:hypothetical protein
VEQFHAFKALEDPAHRWLVGGFVDVIGNGLLALLQALANRCSARREMSKQSSMMNLRAIKRTVV